jgi:hypothetical protein
MPPGYRPGSVPLAGGVPWEGPGGILGRWWHTVSAVNFRGRELFAAASDSNDAMTACLFSMMSLVIYGLFIVMLFTILFLLVGAAFFGLFSRMGLRGLAAIGTIELGILFLACGAIVITCAVYGFVMPWIAGGVHHLVLVMLGGVGEGREYAHSVRVAAYAGGAAMLWAMVPMPYLNAMVMTVFNAINHVTGYDEVHQCGTGKAFLAWVSPVVCCCCSGVLFALLTARFR